MGSSNEGSNKFGNIFFFWQYYFYIWQYKSSLLHIFMIQTKVCEREYCQRDKRFLSAEFFSNNKHITESRITSSTFLFGVDHLTFGGGRGGGVVCVHACTKRRNHAHDFY